jgi:hypothetical protein
MVEVWNSGNVAFTPLPVAIACNGKFTLNAPSPGFENQYAALMAAKSLGECHHIVLFPALIL